ncbi:hypothetical protein DRQ09_09360 [candidate division KSB1 bacterium]|nr:MAG: hypothetical protein DRQ09_09360 [candidate division KSB1 bacterium]
MKYFKTLLWIGYILSVVSIIIGIIDKIAGFVIFNLGPLSYFRFSVYCLVFIISLCFVQLVLGKKE